MHENLPYFYWSNILYDDESTQAFDSKQFRFQSLDHLRDL